MHKTGTKTVANSAQIADLWVADLRVAEARCIETQYIETRLTEAEQFAAANPPQHSAQHIVRTVVNTLVSLRSFSIQIK